MPTIPGQQVHLPANMPPILTWLQAHDLPEFTPLNLDQRQPLQGEDEAFLSGKPAEDAETQRRHLQMALALGFGSRLTPQKLKQLCRPLFPAPMMFAPNPIMNELGKILQKPIDAATPAKIADLFSAHMGSEKMKTLLQKLHREVEHLIPAVTTRQLASLAPRERFLKALQLAVDLPAAPGDDGPALRAERLRLHALIADMHDNRSVISGLLASDQEPMLALAMTHIGQRLNTLLEMPGTDDDTCISGAETAARFLALRDACA